MVAFSSGKWEGKGFVYFMKDSAKNRSVIFALIPVYGLIVPAMCAYEYFHYEQYTLKKNMYKTQYIVLRDDDPKVRDVIKFDKDGNRVYLEPRKN